MNHDRVPQNNDKEETPIGGLLEEVSLFARRVLESVQAAAGTTYCKGVQLNELKKFAIDRDIWIEDASTLGIFTDRGSENEVYLSNKTICYVAIIIVLSLLILALLLAAIFV